MRAVVAKLYQRVSNFTIALILAVSSVTAMAPFIFSQAASAVGSGGYTYASTNDDNRINGNPHVDFVSATGSSVTVDLINPKQITCFEYRTDGDTSQAQASANFNIGVSDLYPYWCVTNNTVQKTIPANQYVEIRSTFGAERDWDFDWVRFDTLDTQRPQLSNISIDPMIGNNIGGVVTVYFDLTDTTGVDTTKTKVLFSDGPNTSNAKRESAKFSPIHISGDSYKVEINTLDFVKANWTGQYNLAFNLYDTLGNHGSSKPSAFRNVLIDNSGPTSTLQSPTSGAIINGTQRFTFGVSDHTGVASGYMKFQGQTTQYTLTDGGSGTWYADVDTTTLVDGDYTIDARFVDLFGKARYGANKGTVTVDSKAPHVEITNPTGTLYNSDVEVRGTVDDLHPRHYWLNIKLNGSTLVNQTILATSFTDQLLYTATLEGDYVVTLAARDAAGGTADSGNRSVNVTRSFTIDKTVQAPTLVSPADGAVVKGTSVTQEWSTTDSDIDYYIYESYNDASATSLRWHEQFSSTSKTATNVAEAEYWWRVKAVDYAGNVSDWSDLWKITIDNTSPTIYIVQGSDFVQTSLVGNVFNTVSFKLFDAQNIDKVEINGVVKELSNNTWSDVNGVTAGVFGAVEGTNTIVVYDEAGNTTSYTFVIDTNAPAVPANLVWTPAGSTALTTGDTTNISGGVASWDVSDPDTVQYIYKYWNDIVGNTYKEVTPWTTTSSSNSLPGVFNQGDGTHYFSVAAVDAAGNQSAFSAPFAVVFDTTTPIVTIDALTTTDTTPTLTGSVDDTAATVVVTIGGTDYTAINNGDSTWTVTIPALALGTYTATVTATDVATNVGTATADVTVEQIVVQENNPDTDEDDETAPQTIVTPTPDPDVLGEQDDQEQATDDVDNSDQGVAAAQDENSEDSGNDGTIAGLAWYWWLLILAAVAGFIWWLIGALRRRSAES